MREINLLDSAPKIQRRFDTGWRTDKNREISKRFDKEYFDGDRANGYGGYYYDGRWRGVVRKLQEIYGIDGNNAVLDIGCAKGFLLYDLQDIIPRIKVAGIDISMYAINKAMDGYTNYLVKQGFQLETAIKLEDIARRTILPSMITGSADELPYADNSFDVVLAMNTIHNLPKEKCRKSIQEMVRVCRNKKNMFILVDAYTNELEKKSLDAWNLTALTYMSLDEWVDFFKECNYDGDYCGNILRAE